MSREYRYDAFISYRHTELDRFVAENLIKQLEAYKLPQSVKKKLQGKKTKIERVFRDREELPLTNNLEEPIVEALQSSEWLIVVCSPRLPQSMWCKKEIETFISLRGREHVLAVLIEGEPNEAFPEELLYKIEEVQNTDGTIEQRKVPVEPLAADFRGEGKKGVAKAMKGEILRVLAAIFQVPFDDLRQRHRERKMRRIVTASLLIGTGCLLFGVYSTATALRIKAQKDRIEAQSEQILEQSMEIQAKSEEIQKQNQEITKQNEALALRQAKSLAQLAKGFYEDGDNKNAVKTAVEALTESGGIPLPYTPQAQLVLTDSLRAYDTGGVFRAGYQYEMSGRIESITISPDGKTLAMYDAMETLLLFDLESREEIATLTKELNSYFGKYTHCFLDGTRFVYVNDEDEICIYDLEKKAVTDTIQRDYTIKIFTDKEGRYLLAEGFGKRYDVYDSMTYKQLGTIEKPQADKYGNIPIVFAEGVLADTYYRTDEKGRDLYTLYFSDVKSGELISACYMDVKWIRDIKMQDEVAYVLSGDYAEGYVDCDTYVTAIAVEDGRILWENKLQGFYPDSVTLPENKGATDLICVVDGGARLMNMQTGEITLVVSLECDVLKTYTYSDSNNFLLLLENGGLAVVSKAFDGCYDLSNRLECKSIKNAFGFRTVYGIVIQEVNDKKITVYTTGEGPGVKKSERIVDFPEPVEKLYGEEACEMARTYGLEYPEYVNSSFTSEDGKYAIVRFWDNSLTIYDTEENKVLNTIEDSYPVEWCLGTDATGYTYLLGYNGCYVLDKNMEPVAWILDVREVDLQNRIVYMESDDTYYEAPVYSVEELLQMAEEAEG